MGFVDPFLLNFVWAHNYMPNIEKNVKKETDFNFKLQRSSDNKNVVKMMKTTLTDVLLFLETMFNVVAVKRIHVNSEIRPLPEEVVIFQKEKLLLM